MTEAHPNAGSAQSTDATAMAFSEYGGELHRFLTRRMRCAHTARDLAQDVYLRFMLVARREGVRNPQAFLYQLASHLIYELRMRERSSQVIYDSDLVETADHRSALAARTNPLDSLTTAEQLDRVLGPLPRVYRAVLLMRKRDGLSPEEIAQRLGFTKKTVYEYLTRAMTLIKEQQLDRR